MTRERLLPGPEDGTGRVLLPVQNRVDRVAELDDAVDALAVREDERQAARLLVPLGADSYQRPVALVVDEPPFGVDEPEAAVAPDASALEHDLVGVHEPERLDGRDRDADDATGHLLNLAVGGVRLREAVPDTACGSAPASGA